MRPVVTGGVWMGVLLSALVGCVAKPRLGGPLPVRNQHPAQLLVMHMDPADASVLSAGRAAVRTDFAYTSLFLLGDAPTSSFTMDGELLRSAVDAKLGLGDGLQLGVQLAAAHTSGGFLDRFVIDYHDLFGFPDQQRSANPRDQWRVEAEQNGQTVWAMDQDGFEWLDLPIQLTWQLREPGTGRLGLAVRGGVELPTGDDDRGFGNGELDASVGALWDYRTACVGLSGHVQHAFAGTPDRSKRRGLSFGDVTSIGAALELPLATDLHAIVQAEWETSTLRELGPQATSREQLLLWVGGRYRPSRDWAVEIGFGEDLIGLVSPDFSAWLSIVWTPGG